MGKGVKNGAVNNGAHFENAVAQQLTANGLEPYFCKKKNIGEMDFAIEIFIEGAETGTDDCRTGYSWAVTDREIIIVMIVILKEKEIHAMRKILAAAAADKQEILKLYRMQLGREFCPWNEHYPGMDEIEFDLSREALFVMWERDEGQDAADEMTGQECGRIIAAISIDQDSLVEALECWSENRKPGAELSRLAVHPDVQNQGIAREMIQFAMGELVGRGYKSVHFLVNKLNTKALRSYAKLGCDVVGECDLYEQPFLCYEKSL